MGRTRDSSLRSRSRAPETGDQGHARAACPAHSRFQPHRRDGRADSPKLTESEVEAFAKMGNVSEDVLRIIGTNRAWLKNYGIVARRDPQPEDTAGHLDAADAPSDGEGHQDAVDGPQRPGSAAAVGAPGADQGEQQVGPAAYGPLSLFPNSLRISARPSM